MISLSRRTDLVRPSWPKALTHGFWFLGHMDAKNPFLTKFWLLELSVIYFQNFVRNGFLTLIWPKYHNPDVKPFGHDGRNKSVLWLGLEIVISQPSFTFLRIRWVLEIISRHRKAIVAIFSPNSKQCATF